MPLPFVRLALPLLVLPLLACNSASANFGAVSVGGVSIAHLDQTSATRRLRRELAPRLERRVALTAGTKIVYRRRRDLGFSLDVGKMLGQAAKAKQVPIAFSVNQKALSHALARLAPQIVTHSRDARPVLMGKKVSIRPEVVGVAIIPAQSAARIKIQAEKEAGRTRFALAAHHNAPRLTKARLKGVNAILATFSTRFNPGKAKRTLNMRVAIRSIDGTLLSPDEVFSLNKTVGERTQARGYRTAIIFEEGKEKPGLGGGVSQVTGTLFNAALVAGLPIVTYRTHSRPVVYLKLGRDATVAWNSFDMKFKNDTKAPVFISYKINGSIATATLLGHGNGKRGVMNVVSKHKGPRQIDAVLFRTIRQNGKVVKKERVGHSNYNWKADNED